MFLFWVDLVQNVPMTPTLEVNLKSLNPTICWEPLKHSLPNGDNMSDVTMGDQQITTAEIGWLAGIIDGEGNLDLNHRCGLHRQGRGTWNWDRPRIIIGNTDAIMIQKISEIYSKIGCKFWYSLLKRQQESHKTCMLIITIGIGNVSKVLSIIYPYLTAKKLQAEVLLDYCNWRTRAMQSDKKEDWMWGSESVGI